MRIYYKDTWGFWFLKYYYIMVEDDNGFLTEIKVEKDEWNYYNVGDIYEQD